MLIKMESMLSEACILTIFMIKHLEKRLTGLIIVKNIEFEYTIMIIHV